MTRSAATCCSAPSPAAPTCAPASSARARCCRSGPGSSPAAAWAPRWRPTTSRPAGHRPGRRAGPHRADAVHAGRLLGRPGRDPVPGELLRGLPGGLAARRLDRAAARRRLRHLRPVRRHPQPRRRADGHQRVLPRGRGLRRDQRQPGRGHRAARRRRPADPVRRARRRARSTTTWPPGSARRCGPSCPRGTCPTRSARSRASRGRCPARSWRCRCARSCSAPTPHAPPTRTLWPTRTSWPTSRRRPRPRGPAITF